MTEGVQPSELGKMRGLRMRCELRNAFPGVAADIQLDIHSRSVLADGVCDHLTDAT
jgi:hypothetical protein